MTWELKLMLAIMLQWLDHIAWPGITNTNEWTQTQVSVMTWCPKEASETLIISFKHSLARSYVSQLRGPSSGRVKRWATSCWIRQLPFGSYGILWDGYWMLHGNKKEKSWHLERHPWFLIAFKTFQSWTLGESTLRKKRLPRGGD